MKRVFISHIIYFLREECYEGCIPQASLYSEFGGYQFWDVEDRCTDLRLKPLPDLERRHVTENVMRKAFVSPSVYGKLCIYVVWGVLD